ncbi:MAG: hypothetical protein GAK40_00626 [Burkholderia plantarii]|nr:MAG: hypothetical protein GAK40_00626 [Burkholderia plantarii]
MRNTRASLDKVWKMVAAAAIALPVIAGAAVAVAGWQVRPHPAQLAVVLGNKVYRDGTPDRRLAARLGSALDLYRRGQCEWILVSGGIETTGTNEADAMRAWLVARGVPAGRIIVDELGDDT